MYIYVQLSYALANTAVFLKGERKKKERTPAVRKEAEVASRWPPFFSPPPFFLVCLVSLT